MIFINSTSSAKSNPRSFTNSSPSLILIAFLSIVASYLLGCIVHGDLKSSHKFAPIAPPRHVTKSSSNVIIRHEAISSVVAGYSNAHVENIVHPAMLAHPNPRNVLIIGGSQDDAQVQVTVKEVLKYKAVEDVAVVAALQAATARIEEPIRHEGFLCHIYNRTREERVEYFDYLEGLHHLSLETRILCEQKSSFDVVILLNPFSQLSNVQLDTTIQNLSEDFYMSKNGIFATHLGPSPHLHRKKKMKFQEQCHSFKCSSHLQLQLIGHLTTKTKFTNIHVYEDTNGSGAQSIRTPQSFLVLCKDIDCNKNWYAGESYINYQIRKRLSSPPLYVDGATLNRYTRPHKAWENLFCSFPENKRECSYLNGFDPSVPNVPREAFEVKPSSIGKNVGRGLFTKVDIVEGSYFMQEVAVHQVIFSVQSVAVILKTKKRLMELYNETAFLDLQDYAAHLTHQKNKYEIDSLVTYMDGYGYDDITFGPTGNFVDSGMNTFMNHGCKKTFNFGSIFLVFDRKAGITNSKLEYLLLSEEEADPNKPQIDEERNEILFNPLSDRHLDHQLSSCEGAIFNVVKGQELFSNYVHYNGIDGWASGIQDLRAECRGEKVGTVVKVEGIDL